MNQNKLTFDIENLVVDWIGFNSTRTIGSDGKEESLFNESKNKYKVSFRVYNYSEIYWDGLKIDFSSLNGHQFYKFIGANLVNWKIFSYKKYIRLSRLDLCYPYKKTNVKTNFKSFLDQCYQKVVRNKALKNFRLQQNSFSSILKIGRRGSPNHFRVYENYTEIRFELEQRGLRLKAVQNYLFDLQIYNFEQIMVKNFFNYLKKVLIADENYTD